MAKTILVSSAVLTIDTRTLKHRQTVSIPIGRDKLITGTVDGSPWCDRHGNDRIITAKGKKPVEILLPCDCDRRQTPPNRFLLNVLGGGNMTVRVIY